MTSNSGDAERIAKALDPKARKESDGAWSCCCPAHDDHSPSLSLDWKDGKLVWHCWAGCSQADVQAELKRRGLLGKPDGSSYEPKPKAKSDQGNDWRPIVPVPEGSAEPAFTHHKHGKPTTIWTYLGTSGEVLLHVARFDPPGQRKEIMPRVWGALNGATGWHWKNLPEDRPLYGLDRLAARPDAPVLVVEGEKAADAAAQLLPDYVVMTWQGGSNATGKALWASLAGRKVTIWPDADEAGHKAAKAVADALRNVAASVRTVEIPADLPKGWDLADPIPDGIDVKALIEGAKTPILSAYDLGEEWDADLITGPAPPVKWLAQGTLPFGVASLLASMGDVGKSFKMLELALRVATYDDRRELLARPIFGGSLVAGGRVVFLTAEEDRKAIHRRLDVVDPEGLRHKYPGRLKIITLPDAGGPKPLIIVSGKGELQLTSEGNRLIDSLLRIQDLALFMLDPTQAFVHANINADPSAGQFFCTTLAAIAAQTGACALASHHMRKTDDEITTLAEARAAIRGTSALVDGVRVAHTMWQAPAAEAKKTCKALNVEYQANRVVWGGVSKGNEIAGREIRHYVRADSGLLLDRTMDLRNCRPSEDSLEGDLIGTITLAAANGRPLQKDGKAGLYTNRERLPESLRVLGRDPLLRICQDLLDAGRVVKAKATGSNIPQWLDVPGGPFALGIGEFADGYKP